MFRSTLVSAWRLVLLLALQTDSAHAQFPPVAELPNLHLTNVVGETVNAGTIIAIARQPDGKMVVGGRFTHVGGVERHNLVRLDRDGSLDPAWAPDPDGPVFALDVHGAYLYVGGLFDHIGGQLRYKIARIDTTGTDAADPVWDPEAEASGFVSAIVATDSAVYAGGDYAFIGGQSVNDLAKLNLTNGDADPGWQPTPLDPDPDGASILALAADGSGLYVGGIFTQIGGVGRTNLAKLSTTTGATLTWNASTTGGDIGALSIVGQQIYAAGSFTQIRGVARTHIARLSTSTGAVDPSFNASIDSGLTSVAATTGEVYIGGAFSEVGGLEFNNIARLDLDGAPDPVWNPGANGEVTDMIVHGDDVFAVGLFSQMSGQARSGLALLTVPEAPVLVPDGGDRFRITRNPADGSEVTHFRIVAVNGGTLRRADGSQLLPGGFASIADGEAGLTLDQGAMVTVSSAVRPAPFADGVASAALTISATAAPPTFRFAGAAAKVSEGGTALLVEIQKIAGGAGTVQYVARGETATSGSDFGTPSGGGQLSFGASETSKFFSVPITGDGSVEGDETFALELANPGGGGRLASPASLIVTILDDDMAGSGSSSLTVTTPAPALPAQADGSIRVNLAGDSGQGLWRLLGDVTYHGSGATVGGLTTGNYTIELRPVDGLITPANIMAPVDGTDPTTVVANATYSAGSPFDPGTGSLSINIEPSNLAGQSQVAMRGQWRRVGEGAWRDGGDTVALSAGRYEVEFKIVPGRITPGPMLMAVQTGQTNVTSGLYLIETGASAAPEPAVLPFNPPSAGAPAVTTEPYLFNGQIHTEVGFGSGVVTKEHVVLTAAHVVFDDAELAYVKDVLWFHQRHRGFYDPAPVRPRGWYRFDGYARQREVDVDDPAVGAGVGSPASQNLDVAALYFSAPAARGGSGGYLASDAIGSNPWLGSAEQKFVVGYPVDGIASADRARMHATTPANASFTHIQNFVYRSTSFRTSPGNSGGPIYVRANDGTGVFRFYPAAIYVGGTGQTLVRAIDSAVVNLMDLAEVAASTDDNGTGGGSGFTAPGLTNDAFAVGQVTTRMRSPRDGGWQIVNPQGGPPSVFFESDQAVSASPGDLEITFREVRGFARPGTRNATVYPDQLTRIDAAYTQNMAAWTQLYLTDLGVNTNTAPLDDHDQDGLVHLVERAFNLSPTDPDTQTLAPGSGSVGLPHASLAGTGADRRLTLEFVRWHPDVAPDLTYTPEFAGAPGGPFTPSALAPTITELGGGWQRVVVQDALTSNQRSLRFGRVRVTQSP